jgi:hypothetical protein
VTDITSSLPRIIIRTMPQAIPLPLAILFVMLVELLLVTACEINSLNWIMILGRLDVMSATNVLVPLDTTCGKREFPPV